MGRMQLALPVLYDKKSQLTMADKKALIKSDLSISTEKFVKQRIHAIGQ